MVEKLNCHFMDNSAIQRGTSSTKVAKQIQEMLRINTQAPARDHHSRSSSSVILLDTPTDTTPTTASVAETSGTPKQA